MSIAPTPPVGSGLPTHLDLPHTDDKPVENFYQPEQSFLLTGSLTPHLDRLHPDGRYAIGSDSGIYWELKPNVLDGCRAPDWFYIPGVPKTLGGILRKSYVMWQEKVPPRLVVEYVSGSGAEERDATPETGKFWVYERGIRAEYYAIHDPFRRTLDVFHRTRGRYRAMTPDAAGRFPIPEMKLALGIWDGRFHGYKAHWLRGWNEAGDLIPAPEEQAEQQRRRAEQERQRADQERRRADALAAKLRDLGVDPDQL